MIDKGGHLSSIDLRGFAAGKKWTNKLISGVIGGASVKKLKLK